MPASGPNALPPAYTANSLETLQAADHPTLHENLSLEVRALWTAIGLITGATGVALPKVRLTDDAGLGLNDVFARPNKLRNARFDHWTAGASFSADGLTADEWRASKGTGGSPAMTVSRQAHALADIPGEPPYFYRHQQTAQATSTPPYLEQRLDDVRQEANQYVTVSGWIRCGTGSVVVTPRASQVFGTGGSPSATVDTDGSTITATTTWTRFVRRIQVPSVAGKTVGSNADSYLAVQLRGPLSSTWTLDFSQLKVERGQAATEFEQIDPRIRKLLAGQLAGSDLSASAGIAAAQLATGTKGYALLAGASAPQFDRLSRKNFLINGGMQVSQRIAVNSGVSVTDNTYMTADRWRMLYDSASNAPSTYNSTSFFTLTAGASFNALTFQASNAATGRHGMFQVIESKDAAMLRGTSVSLSFLAFAQAGFSDIRAAILYWTGTADAVSSDPVTTWSSLVSGTPGNASGLSGSWLFANTPTNLSVGAGGAVFKIENISIPQSATNVAVLIWCDDTTTTFGEFWGVTNAQLEKGAVSTPFEMPTYAQELQMCQRYYFKTFPQSLTPAQNTGNANGALAYVAQVGGTTAGNGAMLRYPSIMRASPTVTFFNISAANTKWRNVSLGADSATPVTVGPNESGVFVTNAQVAGDLVSHQIMVHLTADAEL